MSLFPSLAHSFIAAASRPDYRLFCDNCRAARAMQESILMRIVSENRDTQFGREHGFGSVTGIESYRGRVPVGSYETFGPLIAEAMKTGSPVLTKERPLVYEPTSGSAAAAKFIPYTPALQKEYSRSINAWLSDLYHTITAIKTGRHFWSISPPSQASHTAGDGTPVGFADDTAYLGWKGKILGRAMAVPSCVRLLSSMENFKYSVCYFLLSAHDLTLISIWNPSFISLLLDTLHRYADRIIGDIARGTLTLPEPEPATFLDPFIAAQPQRSRECASLFSAFGNDAPVLYRGLWTRLSLVSCWTDGPSAEGAARLRALFPDVVLQAKGLCATEGIVSIPLCQAGGAVAAYTSHFLEFVPQAGEGARCVDELETGGAYSVLLTTGGGLYRYALGDCVRVTGRMGALPVLSFIGREHVSDMTGEKLHEEEVARAVRAALADENADVSFWMVSPEQDGAAYYYVLYCEAEGSDTLSFERGVRIGRRVEEEFCKNFHYQHSRRLGQLSPLRFFRVFRGGQATYFRRCLAEGKKAGSIKPALLDTRTGWQQWFTGMFCDPDARPAVAGAKTGQGAAA
jgi:hypothetical protein